MGSLFSKKVLLLGCGLVTAPLIEYLNEEDFTLIIATRTVSKAHKAIERLKKKSKAKAVQFDIEEKGALEQLDDLIKDADIVISLLPYEHHVTAAKIAIKYKKNFCTSSYVSAEMRELGPAAEKAKIILFNECGVDPGLDHMSAKKVIDEVHAKGGKVVSFTSLCGGLPKPDANDNPFGYKLSWSPRGVLLASKNPAKYLDEGKEVEVDGLGVFSEENVRSENVDPIGELEWYLNRDCTPYRNTYQIPEASTLIRGTYRYVGWCRLLKAMTELGLTSTEKSEFGDCTFEDCAKKVFGDNPKAAIAERLTISEDDEILQKLEWLGLFSEEKIPEDVDTMLDAMGHLCKEKLVYKPDEKDMLLMRHTFHVEYGRSHRERIISTMIDYGLQPDGHSSMARTVSLPLAVAVKKILKKDIKLKGLQIPVEPQIYHPILEEMAKMGVTFKEETLAPLLWIRAEVKPGEERVILTPDDCKVLVEQGYTINLESSETRCFSDEDYKEVATIVPPGSWTTAQRHAIILGLKELPDEPNLLEHRHVFFAHCYKNQGGWKEMMARFTKSDGMVWDLEFLTDDKGRRVAAFGRPAGVNGMAVGLMTWAAQQLNKDLPALHSYKSVDDMIAAVKEQLAEAQEVAGRLPSVHVMGALGRCGGGATWFAEQCELKEIAKWDLEETAKGGPFPEILKYDVFINCIYLAKKIPPFINEGLLSEERNLTVLVDVSCDTSNPYNPVPVYKDTTTFAEPVLTVIEASEKNKIFQVVAIDHLPSLTPVESSIAFSQDLLPHMKEIRNAHENAIWKRAEEKFEEVEARMGKGGGDAAEGGDAELEAAEEGQAQPEQEVEPEQVAEPEQEKEQEKEDEVPQDEAASAKDLEDDAAEVEGDEQGDEEDKSSPADVADAAAADAADAASSKEQAEEEES